MSEKLQEKETGTLGVTSLPIIFVDDVKLKALAEMADVEDSEILTELYSEARNVTSANQYWKNGVNLGC